jgi:hypothetical protein
MEVSFAECLRRTLFQRVQIIGGQFSDALEPLFFLQQLLRAGSKKGLPGQTLDLFAHQAFQFIPNSMDIRPIHTNAGLLDQAKVQKLREIGTALTLFGQKTEGKKKAVVRSECRLTLTMTAFRGCARFKLSNRSQANHAAL